MPGIGDFLPPPPTAQGGTGIGTFLPPSPAAPPVDVAAGQRMYESGAGGGTPGQVAGDIAGLFWPGGIRRPQSFGQYEAQEYAPPPPGATSPGALARSAIGAALAGAQIAGTVVPALRLVGRGIGGFLERTAQAAPSAAPAIAPEAAAAAGPAQAAGTAMAVASEASLTPAQTVIQALKAATPARAEQEALYTAERGRRIAQAVTAGEQTPGQAGYFQQLGALKGALPRAQFTPLAIDQPTVDALFNQVRASPVLSDFNKITAQTGLMKLFGAAGGEVPTEGELGLLGRVFGDEFVQAVQSQGPQGTLRERLLRGVGEVLSVPRSIMASISFVSPFRHGLFTAASYPRQFAVAFGQQFKYFASEDAFQAMAQDVVGRPSYDAMEEHGLALTGLANAANPTAREEQFVGTLAQRIPVIGRVVTASNRAYTGFLMKLRADLWDELTQKASTAGVDQSPQFLDGVARFINSATGRGDLGMFQRASGMLSTTLFAPRLLASRLNLLNPLYYASLPPMVRTDALRSLFAFTSAGMTALGVAKAGGADVGTDPTSADFGKIRIGNTRIDLWGGFVQPVRLAAQLMAGQTTSSTTGKRVTLGSPGASTRMDVVSQALESKAAPVVGFAVNMLKGKTFGGQPVDPASEVGKMFVPLIAQSFYDLASQPDSAGLLGVPFVPFFGEQTYGPPRPPI